MTSAGHGKEKICKGCKSHVNRAVRFGITPDQYYDLLDRQKNKCGICNSELPPTNSVIDHCHETGIIRGVLCRQCNTAIGMLRDQSDKMTNAQRYLDETRDTGISPKKIPNPYKAIRAWASDAKADPD